MRYCWGGNKHINICKLSLKFYSFAQSLGCSQTSNADTALALQSYFTLKAGIYLFIALFSDRSNFFRVINFFQLSLNKPSLTNFPLLVMGTRFYILFNILKFTHRFAQIISNTAIYLQGIGITYLQCVIITCYIWLKIFLFFGYEQLNVICFSFFNVSSCFSKTSSLTFL